MTYRSNRRTSHVPTSQGLRRGTRDDATKVLILGLGSYPGGTGVQSAIYFAKRGADVLVTDLKTAEQIGENVKTLKRYKNVKFRLGENRQADLEWADIIVRNPDIKRVLPIYKAAVKTGKPLINDITVFLEASPAPTVGVTGTRGKSTTTSWIYDMLRRSGKKAYLGGNITVSPLTFLDKLKKNDIAVVELSSWLLEPCGDMGLSPHIAVWTNVMSDHLNAYDGVEDYAEAKAQIMRNQGPKDIFIPNLDDAIVSSYMASAAGEVRGFSLKRKKGACAWTAGEWLVMKHGDKEVKVIKAKDLSLKGAHNVMNALAAMVGASTAGATLKGIRDSLRKFGGVPYRQELVGVKRGVTFINDTTATTPDAAIAALWAFASPKTSHVARRVVPGTRDELRGTIHWICGGASKKLDFAPLAQTAAKMKLDIHVLVGTAYDELTKEFEKRKVRYTKDESLKAAFDGAVAAAKPGDIVLLSPACASFGLFKNEFDRGDQFNVLVKKLKNR